MLFFINKNQFGNLTVCLEICTCAGDCSDTASLEFFIAALDFQ